MLHKDDVEGAGSSKGGVIDIAGKDERSHMLAVRGGSWIILDGGVSACHALKPDEGDDVETEVTILIDEVEDIPVP